MNIFRKFAKIGTYYRKPHRVATHFDRYKIFNVAYVLSFSVSSTVLFIYPIKLKFWHKSSILRKLAKIGKYYRKTYRVATHSDPYKILNVAYGLSFSVSSTVLFIYPIKLKFWHKLSIFQKFAKIGKYYRKPHRVATMTTYDYKVKKLVKVEN